MSDDKKTDTAVTTNRKAFHDYFVEETFEAGMALQGTEVKSLRLGLANLTDSYAIVKNNEVFLFNHGPHHTRWSGVWQERAEDLFRYDHARNGLFIP